MNIKFVDNSPEGQAREQQIAAVLPKETIISQILEPSIEKRLFGILAACISAELEIYRAYPKKPDKVITKETVKEFDPTNNESCFMGKGFRGNSEVQDSELSDYRKAIGTIPHPVWGNCTLLEIWGGDHFEDHNKMVVDAFKYGAGLISTKPTIKVFVNPLFQNSKSKKFRLSEAQKEHKEFMDDLLAKALVFGVKEPKKRKRRY